MLPAPTIPPMPTPAAPAPGRTTRLTRAFLFLVSAIPLGAAALAVLLAGWITTGVLVVTPLVVPAVIAFGAVVRWLAIAEAALARRLLGSPVGPPRPPAAAGGFWRRGWAVVADRRFWNSQVYLLGRILLGWPLAIAWLALVAGGLGTIVAPITYRWIPQDGWHGYDLGIRRIDTLPESMALVPVGVLVVVAALGLLQPLAALWRGLAAGLLGGNMELVIPGAASTTPRTIPTGVSRRRALVVHAAATAGAGVLLLVIWVATTRGYLWPVWPLLALALALTIHGWVVFVEARPDAWRSRRLTPALAVHAGVAGAIVLFLVGVWAMAGGGYFWPVWPLSGLAVPVAIHWGVVQGRRIEHLETARDDVVQVQETDLRRIERDLHDGAQARLVALGMNLGLAEQRMAQDPEGARQLVTEARHGVTEALQELRDLVRGIRPPVLADRGLEAAISALADRSPITVDVVADVRPRPSDPVETAAYFVVAEALSNAAKHSGASRIDVRIQRQGASLVVEVSDDGHGGADGGGSGLNGLRQRVEALDGTLTVSSPAGGPTTVRAELPCGS